MLKVLLLLLLWDTGHVTQASPAFPGESLKRSQGGDYQDLLSILGEKVPGNVQDKADVIDLLLHLLAEIDLPTLCGVIANDTSSRKRNVTSHFSHWSALSLFNTDQLPSRMKSGQAKSASDKDFDIISTTVLPGIREMGSEDRSRSNIDIAVQGGGTYSESENEEATEDVKYSRDGNDDETVQRSIGHGLVRRKEDGAEDEKGEKRNDEESEIYDKELESDLKEEERNNKEAESIDKEEEGNDEEEELKDKKDEIYDKEMEIDDNEEERYVMKVRNYYNEIESNNKEGKSEKEMLNTGEVQGEKRHGHGETHFEAGGQTITSKGHNSVHQKTAIHSLPTNTRTIPSRFLITGGRLKKRVFLPRNKEGKLNTDGALPHPTARRRGPMRKFRLSPLDKKKNLKTLRGRAMYRARQRNHRVMAALGQGTANNGVVIKSIGVQRPRAQLYSSALVLGDWARRKARPEFASLGNTAPPAQLNGSTRKKETLRGVNDIDGKNDYTVGDIPGVQISMKQKEDGSYEVDTVKASPSPQGKSTKASTVHEVSPTKASSTPEGDPMKASQASEGNPIKAPRASEVGLDDYDSPTKELSKLPSRDPSSSVADANIVPKPRSHVTSKRLVRVKGGRVRGKWRRVSKGKRNRMVLLRTGKLRRMRMGMRKRMRMRASQKTIPEANGMGMKRYRYFSGYVPSPLKYDSIEMTDNIKVADLTDVNVNRDEEKVERGVTKQQDGVFDTRENYEENVVTANAQIPATEMSTVNNPQLSTVEASQTEIETQTSSRDLLGDRDLNDKVEDRNESSSVILTGKNVHAGISLTSGSQEELEHKRAETVGKALNTVSEIDLHNNSQADMNAGDPSTSHASGTRHRDHTGKDTLTSSSDLRLVGQQEARRLGLQTPDRNARLELQARASQTRIQAEIDGHASGKMSAYDGQEGDEVDELQPQEGDEVEELQPQEGDEVEELQPQEGDEVDELQPQEGDEVEELQPQEGDEVEELLPQEGDEVEELQPQEGDEVEELQPQEGDEVEELQPQEGDEVEEFQPQEGDEVEEFQPQEGDEVEELQPQEGGEMDRPHSGNNVDETTPFSIMDSPQENEAEPVFDVGKANIQPDVLSKNIKSTDQSIVGSESNEWTTTRLASSSRMTSTGVVNGVTVGLGLEGSKTTAPWTTDSPHGHDDLNETTPFSIIDRPHGDNNLNETTPISTDESRYSDNELNKTTLFITTNSPHGHNDIINHEAILPGKDSSKKTEDKSREMMDMLEKFEQSNEVDDVPHTSSQSKSLHSADAQLENQSDVQAPSQESVSDLLPVGGSQDNLWGREHVRSMPYSGNLLETIEEISDHREDDNQDTAVQPAKFKEMNKIISTSPPIDLSPNSPQGPNMTFAPSDSSTSTRMTTAGEDFEKQLVSNRSQFQKTLERDRDASESLVALYLLINNGSKDASTHVARENSTSVLEGVISTSSQTTVRGNEYVVLDTDRRDKQVRQVVTDKLSNDTALRGTLSSWTGAVLIGLGKPIHVTDKTIESEIERSQTTVAGKVVDSVKTNYVFEEETVTAPAQGENEWNKELTNKSSLQSQPVESKDSAFFGSHTVPVSIGNSTDAQPQNMSDAADINRSKDETNGLQLKPESELFQSTPRNDSTDESILQIISTHDVLNKSALYSGAVMTAESGSNASVADLNGTDIFGEPGLNRTEVSFFSVKESVETDAHNDDTDLNTFITQTQTHDGDKDTPYQIRDEAPAKQRPVTVNKERQQKWKDEDASSSLEQTAGYDNHVTTVLRGRTSTAIKLPLFHMPDIDSDRWRTPWTFHDHSRSRYPEKPVARPYMARFSDVTRKRTEGVVAGDEGQESSTGRRLDAWKAYNIVVGAEKSGHLNSLLKPSSSGFGQSSQFGFGQSSQSGFGQSSQSGFGQSSQSGFGQSSQSGFGQSSQSGFGQSSQSGFGQSSQSGFGQSSQSGFGQSSQSGFGQSSQSGFGQSLPPQFGQSSRETVPGLVGLTYPVVNYLWNARPWPNHVTSDEFKKIESINMAATGESRPPRGQRREQKRTRVVTTPDIRSRVQTKTGQDDQSKQWGSRFSQGYFGRVFDEGNNFLKKTDSFGPLQEPQIHEVGNVDAQTENDYMKNVPSGLVNTPQILMEDNAVYGAKDPYYYEEMDKTTGAFSQDLDQNEASTDFNRENSVYSNMFPVRETQNVLVKGGTREAEEVGQNLWPEAGQGEGVRPVDGWSPPLSSVNMDMPAVQDYACPGLFGYYGDPQDCGSFFVCSWGLAYRLHCPPGTLWDASREVCDWAVNVFCLEVQPQASDNAV